MENKTTQKTQNDEEREPTLDKDKLQVLHTEVEKQDNQDLGKIQSLQQLDIKIRSSSGDLLPNSVKQITDYFANKC